MSETEIANYSPGISYFRSDLVWVAITALSANLLLLIIIAAGNPQYLRDYRKNANPDAQHYVLLGENFWSRGVYSRQAEPPFKPDIVRTPVYPLLAGGLNVLFRSILPLYILQAILATATALLVYSIGARLLGRRVALLAGLLYGSDLMLAMLNFEAMSETLFLFLWTLSIWLWVRTIWSKGRLALSFPVHGLIGLLLGLAILTRPMGLYLPIVFLLIEMVLLFVRKQLSALLMPLTTVAVAYVAIFPWIVRNEALYGVPRLTIVDSVNLAYFAGAGVYQAKFGISREEAQARIAADYDLVPHVMTNNFWLANQDVATMDSQLRKAAWDILARNPVAALRSTVIGIVKAAISHNTNELADASGKNWTSPELARLVRGDVIGCFKQLLKNKPLLVLVFCWQTFLAVATIFLGVVGAIALLLDRARRLVAISFLAFIGYYVLTIALVGMDAYARFRSMIVPIGVIFAAVGCVKLSDYLFAGPGKEITRYTESTR